MNHYELADLEQSGQRLVKRKIFSQGHTLKHPLNISSTSSHPSHEKKGVNFPKCQFSYLLTFPLPQLGLSCVVLQLQQVNKLQKILLIIAGTFHRYSEISMLIH